MTARNAVNEESFECVGESVLLSTGFQSLSRDSYDRGQALFPTTVLKFIQTTQPKEWAKLQAILGDKAGDQIIDDLCKWLDREGVLPTLRRGFKCFGRTIRMAYFKGAHGLNPDLEAKYAVNIVSVTRQLKYSTKNENSLDMVLSVNGIPVVTIELKNPMTGQDVKDAVKQYRHDRDPRELIFDQGKRTVVHFAVDPDAVMMTTRLAGSGTRFLPFNRGCDGGAGNPPDPEGKKYRTVYLWEEVLTRDGLLELLAKFVHLQEDEVKDDLGRKVKRKSIVFPRYHQLEAVGNLVRMAKDEGPGHHYLIEHSAGSGKSNTIAWLAHRLASLHDASDKKVFDSVIVVTDRVVLDKQLQDTIYQFEHRQGVVVKIDKHSKQLAEALQNSVPIIITTLQKFPYVTKQLLKMAEEKGEAGTESAGLLHTRRCAVIVDEAHSSQGGEAAADLKQVLGGDELHKAAKKQAEEEGTPDLEGVYKSILKKGKQANLSFFAFTATPKHKTLAVFGRNGEPVHRYTMRQAIEEEFILDVLKNYTTYGTYYKLLKVKGDDPDVEEKKAAKALARFLRLHPHNISQKTEVMVEHFQQFTRHKIGGRAKAMVVTGSRLEAVRYKEGFDKYIRAKGYRIKTLVAFSGMVQDPKVPKKQYTEEGMNDGIKEKQLPEEFASPVYQVLLVAEKYQTGFDQPLLHTMYVDKRLAGIQAVQTLSRLNRTHPLKEDTFVLDFVNEREDIREAFKTYYEGAAMGEEADPARMYAIKGELDTSGIYHDEEVQRFAATYFKDARRLSPGDHQVMNAVLDHAVKRFANLLASNEDEAELWRGKQQSFRNLYGFLSQVIPYQDTDLEKLYVFLRYLGSKLPKRIGGPGYQFDEDVRLEYYRLQKESEGRIDLRDAEQRKLDGPTEVGSGKAREKEVPLSRLIDLINDRFGTDFTQADQLFFDQIVESAILDEGLKQAATANPGDKFELVFRALLKRLFTDRMEQNEDIFVRYMNDDSFQSIVTERLSAEAYTRLREGGTKEPLAVSVEPEAADEDSLPSSLTLLSVAPKKKDRFVTCVPLVPLEAAAGGFGEPQDLSDGPFPWVTVRSKKKLKEGMFVARVVGKSMEPDIPSGSYCLFISPVTGTRNGRVVLAELLDEVDPENGHRYTVKVYESEKVRKGSSWIHKSITLKPVNPDFDPIELGPPSTDRVRIVAELVEVLA